ncbi:hypothetical protein Hanom_Chr16g01452491 [Helianthus anomalus]
MGCRSFDPPPPLLQSANQRRRPSMYPLSDASLSLSLSLSLLISNRVGVLVSVITITGPPRQGGQLSRLLGCRR